MDEAQVVLDLLTDALTALDDGEDVTSVIHAHLVSALGLEAVLLARYEADGSTHVVDPPVGYADLELRLLTIDGPGRTELCRGCRIERYAFGEVAFAALARPVPQPDAWRVWALVRSTPFDPAELALWSTARPHLARIWAHADRLGQQRAQASAAAPADLSHREHQVLTLLADGLSATAIAHRLAVSPRTVHKHLGATYRKLGVNDRLVAVQVAGRLGLLTPRS